MNLKPGRRPSRTIQLNRQVVEELMLQTPRYTRGHGQILWYKLAADIGLTISNFNYIRNKNGFRVNSIEARIIAEALGVELSEICIGDYELEPLEAEDNDPAAGIRKEPMVPEAGDDGELMLIEAVLKTAAFDYRRAYRRKDYATMHSCEKCFVYWLGDRGEDAAAYLRRIEDERSQDLSRRDQDPAPEG
ncbi:MAG: hypothetical protein IKF99_11130 [Oscillospiraceae bacterium]|nr:hypothetical protein [Oscillospiraceae bacterium]